MNKLPHRMDIRQNAAAVNLALKHFWKCNDGAGDTLADSVSGGCDLTITTGVDFTTSGAGKLTSTSTTILTADVADTLTPIGDNPFMLNIYGTATSGGSSFAYGNSFVASANVFIYGQQGFNSSTIYDADSSAGTGVGMPSGTGMHSTFSDNVTGKVFNEIAQVGTDIDLSAIGFVDVVTETMALNGIVDLMGVSLHVFDGVYAPCLAAQLAYSQWLGAQWAAGNKVADPALWV